MLGSTYFHVAPAEKPEWVVVLDETEFAVVPFEPEAEDEPCPKSGLVRLVQSGASVPALAWAVAENLMPDWMVNRWAKELNVDTKEYATSQTMAKAVLEISLGNHPETDK